MAVALAEVLAFPSRSEGRPSNAALILENRVLRATVDTLTTERDELDAELHAHVTERLAAAATVLDLSRKAQRFVAAGYRPTQALLDIERLAYREQTRALAARTPEDDPAVAA